jgi:HEXXH motif-containing protein
MTFPRHTLSSGDFAELAAGGGGEAAVRQLAAAQHSKHVLLVWGVMDAARAAGHPQAGRARRGYELLAEIQRHAPEAVATVLRYPAVGGWAERTLRALRSGPAGMGRAAATAAAPARADPGNAPAQVAAGQAAATGEPGQLAALAAAAAILAGYPCVIEVPVTGGLVTLPSLGQAVLPAGPAAPLTACVRCAPGEARVIAGRQLIRIPPDPGEDAPGWRGLRSLRACSGGRGIQLLLDDLDPFRMPSAALLGGRLDAAEAARWRDVLGHAWDVLTAGHAHTAAEIRAAIRVLTPLQPPQRGQLSASSREVFGAVALSAPTDGLELAVTLAHEVQHNKLGALMDLIPLTRPDDGQRYYAPWRDDPRPAAGLLQGAYAYLGVSGFWRQHRHQAAGPAALRAHAEFARWRDAAAQAAETLLASTSLTGPGVRFATGMLGTLRAWAGDKVTPAALHLARAENDRHWQRWLDRNGDPSSTSAG